MRFAGSEDPLVTGNGNGNKVNMRIEILENLLKYAGDGSSAKVNSLRQSIRRNKSDVADDAHRSLDLLRLVFQAEMTAEIRQIIDRYLRTTFAPAFENLRRNGNDVTEREISNLCVSILDGVKESYTEPKKAVTMLPVEVLKPAPAPEINVIKDKSCKVYESDDNESDCSLISHNSTANPYRSNFPADPTQRPKKRGRPRKVDVDTGRSGTPLMNGSDPVSLHEASKWDPNRLGLLSKFILGSKVNKLLTMGHRGFIFVKYPRIFRYVGDEEDKSWLYERNISTRMSGKVFFMELHDVIELAQRENAPQHIQSELARHAFQVHEKIIVKMKMAMRPLHEQLMHRVPQYERNEPMNAMNNLNNITNMNNFNQYNNPFLIQN
uniref:DNTTIP1_dimer domain-containing protein n=1 Tax=Panagrellus redivivus TaxID=6233 RepID=A0A7E4W2R8_PANRE